MNACEAGVALAPDQFTRVKRSNDKQKQGCLAFNRLHHQEGDRVNIPAADLSGEMAVDQCEDGQQNSDRPEGYLARNIGDAHPRQ